MGNIFHRNMPLETRENTLVENPEDILAEDTDNTKDNTSIERKIKNTSVTSERNVMPCNYPIIISEQDANSKDETKQYNKTEQCNKKENDGNKKENDGNKKEQCNKKEKENNKDNEFIHCIRGFESVNRPLPYKGFDDIKRMMNSKFGYTEGEISIALDIISVYLKGQKLLYLEAKSYCEFYLNRLMMPCILLSSLSSVISGIFNEVPIANKLISGVSAFSAFLMSLISYYKLDARAEAHKSRAYSLDQLISDCEFTSGKILLSNTTKIKVSDDSILVGEYKEKIDNKEKDALVSGNKEKIEVYDVYFIQKYISDIERKVRELKEKNQFIIPSTIINRYLDIYNLNIFSTIKEFQIQELILLNHLKVVYNDCRDIENEIIKNNKTNVYYDKLYDKFKEKYDEKEEYFVRIFEHRKEILKLNRDLTEKIKLIKRSKKSSCFKLCY